MLNLLEKQGNALRGPEERRGDFDFPPPPSGLPHPIETSRGAPLHPGLMRCYAEISSVCWRLDGLAHGGLRPLPLFDSERIDWDEE